MRKNFVALLFMCVGVAAMLLPQALFAAGSTTHAWPSFRHDLSNSAAATGSGYPDTATKLWMVNREDRAYGTGPAANLVR